jgi:MoxR-like ATPase
MPGENSANPLERLREATKRGPVLQLLYGKAALKIATAEELGRDVYVETGNETIDFLVRCIRDGRHAMLVGPRGTGKSYMGAKAVLMAEDGGKLGVVQRIEIQGDPNKPPSDYFDDTVSFREMKERLVPNMITAPFFRLASRDQEKNMFKCHDGPDNRIILRKETEPGKFVEVNRVVVYWDEGNRSSPAMLNAVLGLLAEGRIRRDGISYMFPPVSCILTRNPDGYDANSAKMPSPLIDRFGVQLYVYNPSMETFVAVIAPEFLRRLRMALLREAIVAVNWFVESSSHIQPWLTQISASLDVAEKPDAGTKSDTQLFNAILEADKAFKEKIKPSIGGDQRASFACEAWQRVMRLPDDDPVYRGIAARLAVVVLATWGENRSIEDKPGMQYLPPSVKKILSALAKMDQSVAAHLTQVGDLTRYGTSIRAFEEMLKALLSPMLEKDNTTLQIEGMTRLRSELGKLLAHRCETTFNPDREPSKADRKNDSLLWLAEWILHDVRAAEIISLTQLNGKARRPPSS